MCTHSMIGGERKLRYWTCPIQIQGHANSWRVACNWSIKLASGLYSVMGRIRSAGVRRANRCKLLVVGQRSHFVFVDGDDDTAVIWVRL